MKYNTTLVGIKTAPCGHNTASVGIMQGLRYTPQGHHRALQWLRYATQGSRYRPWSPHVGMMHRVCGAMRRRCGASHRKNNKNKWFITAPVGTIFDVFRTSWVPPACHLQLGDPRPCLFLAPSSQHAGAMRRICGAMRRRCGAIRRKDHTN